ncbi:hypothetical protein [Aquirufa salirivi]|uniref:Uncharacterized protein n=1 Tax=Aquirufa salirivi TaxID=3104729 RepID=A0ABW8RYR3_9BACT
MIKTLTYIFLLFSITAFGQNNQIIVPNNINLPKDTIVKKLLLESINGFLNLKEKPNNENTYVLNEDLLETSVLLDEIKGVEKIGRFNNNNFYKCYLNNVTALDDSTFQIQFSYLGINEITPILKASYEILGKQKNGQFYFCSPLKHNTTTWKTKKISNSLFHYKSTINKKTAKAYAEKVNDFDKKLHAKSSKIEWYGFNDLQEGLRNIGVLYKMDYNGMISNTFTSNENGTLLQISATNNAHFDKFDAHDLWHDRLNNVILRSTTNKAVDEGCAYLYGGSWGISWKEIFQTFKEKVSNKPQTNWLEYYGKFEDFGKSKEAYLMPEYVINALIVQKIEKEKGFSEVLTLLKSGKYNQNNNDYFKTMEKIIGINRTNFNVKVWELINREK